MKIMKLIMLLMISASLFGLNACSSDDDNGGENGDEFLTAKVSGSNFEAAQDPTVIVGAQLSGSGASTVLAIQGGESSGNTVNMTVFGYNGPGTYKTGESLTSTNSIQYIEISPIGTWGSNSATAALGTLQAGTITITSEDGVTVEGTFSFEGYNATDQTTKNVTGGKFKAIID